MAIEVAVVSNSQSARQDLAQLSKSVDNIGKSVEKTTSQLKNFASGLVLSVASVATLNSLAKMSDTLTSLESKLKVSVDSFGSFNEALKDTKRIAVETRNDLATIGALYSKLSMSAKTLGVSQKQVGIVTSNVAKSLALSGASIVEAQAAIMQLGQAMASGKLQGDELRSILENAPQLGQAIANGLGVAIGDLRRLGEEGKLTSELIFGAIIKGTEGIDRQFGKVGVTFGQAFTNLNNAFLILFNSVKNFGKLTTLNDVMGDQPRTLAQVINDAAIDMFKFADNFELNVLHMRTSFWLFVDDVALGLQSLPSTLAKMMSGGALGAMSGILDAFKWLRKIDLTQYIPSLGVTLDIIKNWCNVAERAFFWLYDRVIGHSWIPDLVNGITAWMGKLTGGPLDSVMSFARKVESIFKTMLDSIIKVPFISDFVKQIENLKKKVDDTKFMHNLRQVLGMQETSPGTYLNRAVKGGIANYDTSTFVGRGPLRNREDRGFMHDITNAFASENQIPFLAAITTTIGAGLVTAVESGSVIKGFAAAIGAGLLSGVGGFVNRLIPVGGLIASGFLASVAGGTGSKVIAAVLTTAFGLAAGMYVSNKEVQLTTASITKMFIDGVQGAVKLLFGSGIFGDRGFGGTLLMIAKLALLFKAGREELGKMAISALTAPIKIADTVGDVLQKKAMDFKAIKSDKEAMKVMSEHSDKISKYSKSVRTELKSFSKVADAQGNLLGKSGTRALVDVIKSGDPFQFKAATANLDSQGKIAAKNLQSAIESYRIEKGRASEVAKAADKYKASAESLKATSTLLGERIAQTKEATRQGINAAAGGIGGIFGTLAGFNIGGKIADQMVGYSDWAKVGVQMGAGLLGQGVGAAIGQGIARTLMMSVGLLTSPITLAFAAGVAVIYGAYKAWTEPGWLTDQYDRWKELGREWAEIFLKVIMGEEGFKKVETGANIIYGGKQGAPAKSDAEVTGALWGAVLDKLKSYLPDANSFNKLPEKILDIFIGSAQAAEMNSSASTFPGQAAALARATDNAIAQSTAIVSANEENFQKLVEAIKGRETGGMKNPAGAISPDGAYGSMQITRATFDTWKQAGESFSSETDRVNAALRKLRADFEFFGGDVKKTAAAYIGGRGAVSSSGQIRTDVKDSLGTTPAAYADQVYAKFKGAKGGAYAIVDKFRNGIDELYDIYQKDGIGGLTKHISKMVGILSDEKKSVNSLADAVTNAKTAEETLTAMNEAFANMGVAILSAEEFKTISTDDLKNIERLIVDFYETQAKLAGNVSFVAKRSLESLNTANKNALINTRDAIKVAATDPTGMKDYPQAKEWAAQAWKNMNTALADGLYKAIKGETTFSEFANNFGQAVVNTVVEGLTKGLAQQLLAPLEKIGPEILKKVFNFGGMIGDVATYPGATAAAGIGSMFSAAQPAAKGINDIPGLSLNTALAEGASKDVSQVAKASVGAFKDTIQNDLADMPMWFDTVWETIKGGASSFMSGISSLMSSIGTVASNSWGWVASLFSVGAGVAAATGGSISGPGSGTSDSIPAMLSNGEYVINAKSASKYGSILHAINSGTLGMFAEGGPIGEAASSVGSAVPSATAGVAPTATVATPTVTAQTGTNEQLNAISGQIAGISAQIASSTSAIMSAVTSVNNTVVLSGIAATAANMVLGMQMMLMSTTLGVQLAGISSGMATKSMLDEINFASIMAELQLITLILSTKLFAAGGPVSGPGTGTSDSIPARLSNGEYVINAKSTSKFRPLLDQINSGGELHFADGGAVGTSATSLNPMVTSVVDRSKDQKQGQQVFNINITGDVSRQTRREIAEMMPQIATGVNMHNYEKNRKR